ncbi:MAG TPA: beta-ketoacyl-[acyl-carrier-protein] synthase family protein [Solirubrobacteraceae bacterium]|jgi:minimal PKS ketosynthase (KS/KS alpha)|nr:beta-ketoacyl-[acyl-carrier-protein] synthase family protein [Solirubrobacteraceae bacterium]
MSDIGGTPRRTAVTGVGVVAPGGSTRDSFWEAITAGRTATRRITFFDASGFRSQIAAECDFDPLAAGLSEHEKRRMDRYIQFAVAAAMEAMTDSALESEKIDLDRTGVSLGSAVGGTMVLEDGYVAVSNHGREWLVDPDYAPPFLYQGLIPSSLASEVALKFGAHGPSVVVSTGCTSGIDAIGYGHQMIQDDEADIVIAGAAESGISPISMACFDPIKATSRRNDDAEHASRPFDRDRDGFVMGEGGAVLILEEMQSALARGAHIYCEVTGFASRGNAFHMTGLKPDASEMTEAILDAMAQGGTQPQDIDYINAHGSGTKQNDRHETAAYKKSLGEHAYKVPISSIKSMVGHSLGGIGAIEMATCALAIDRGVVPPTANWETPDPECDLNYTPKVAVRKQIDVALSTGSGFGGFQSAMIFSVPNERRSVGL